MKKQYFDRQGQRAAIVTNKLSLLPTVRKKRKKTFIYKPVSTSIDKLKELPKPITSQRIASEEAICHKDHGNKQGLRGMISLV